MHKVYQVNTVSMWQKLPYSQLIYLKIYLAAHNHSNQIHDLEEQLAQNNGGDMANAAREGKAAVGAFYVYLVFLICYQARDTGLST